MAQQLILAERFTVLSEEKKGGTATIYKAFDLEKHVVVALKVFSIEGRDPDIVNEIWHREHSALSILVHENVVQMLDAGRIPKTDERFIALEWLDGQTLDALLTGVGAISWDEFYSRFGERILSALLFAAERNIAHRDLSPGNVLVTTPGVVKIIDFGQAKLESVGVGRTVKDWKTIPYCMPEDDTGTYTQTRDIQEVQRELKKDADIEGQGPAEVRGRKILRLGQKVASVPAAKVRLLSVYDHAPLLREAFSRAKRRILIVSPWIRANVVNDAFVRRLAECLNRGVEVAIGFGIGREDSGERDPDRLARESLEALTKSFSNFRLVRKGNTHAKVLLVDDEYFVTTSFNWLSFSGDLRQPMREEEGTMVEDAAAVNAYYEKLISRFDAG